MKMTFLSFISAIVLFSCGNAVSNHAPKMELVLSEDFDLSEEVSPADTPVSWDKTVHDFGDVSVTDGPLTCTFTLTNDGSEPIAIFEVVSSCGCTDVKWTRESIQPGKTGSISATYKNEDGPMPFDKTLTVYISGIKRPVILRLRGVVHEKKKSLSQLYGAQKLGDFGLKTRSFKAGTLKQGLSVSETAIVANLGKKPLDVSFADASAQLSMSVKPNPIPSGGTATLSYTVQADPSLYGRNEYRATPVLNGQKASAPLTVLVWTQENFAALTSEERSTAAVPYFDNSTVSFGPVKAGEKLDVEFRCTNKGKRALHFFKADLEGSALSLAAPLTDIDANEKGSVRFTLDTSLLEKGENVIMISLTTNSPLRPLVNLFVAGEVR